MITKEWGSCILRKNLQVGKGIRPCLKMKNASPKHRANTGTLHRAWVYETLEKRSSARISIVFKISTSFHDPAPVFVMGKMAYSLCHSPVM